MYLRQQVLKLAVNVKCTHYSEDIPQEPLQRYARLRVCDMRIAK